MNVGIFWKEKKSYSLRWRKWFQSVYSLQLYMQSDLSVAFKLADKMHAYVFAWFYTIGYFYDLMIE